MFDAFLGKLKSRSWKSRRKSLLIRDQKLRMLSPEAKRELERLQQNCVGDGSLKGQEDEEIVRRTGADAADGIRGD